MTIRELLNEAIAELKGLNYESARLDAELLMMHVTNFNKVQLITHDNEELDQLAETIFKVLLSQRAQGHPIAHLLGERDFWDLTLKVNNSTLIPRPDTEILVEKTLTILSCNKFKRVLDLGTGSGAIILSLKHSASYIEATAVEKSSKALEVAQENAERLGYEINFLLGSWFEPVAKHSRLCKQGHLPRFDVIVSNPPYIEEGDEHLNSGDVRFEPLSALVSGKDGLDDIRHIVAQSVNYLRPHGYLLIEHGYNQGEKVRDLFAQAGYTKIETIRDYGQNERVTLGSLPSKIANSHKYAE